MRRSLWSVTLAVVSLVSASAAAAVMLRPAWVRVPAGDLGPEPEWRLIARGSWTGYDSGNFSFTGGCLAIRDEATWAAFWAEHGRIYIPAPDLPSVDFTTEIVLACLLGAWPDCCVSFVNLTDIAASDGGYRVSVERHYEHGPADAITSPYHFVAADRTEGPVAFFDFETGEPIPEIPPVP